MTEGKQFLKGGEGSAEERAEYKLAFAMTQSPDWEKNSISNVEAGASYAIEAQVLGLKSALQMAVIHLKHMASFIEEQNAGYSFEGLNEDMATITSFLEEPLKIHAKTEGLAPSLSRQENDHA